MLALASFWVTGCHRRSQEKIAVSKPAAQTENALDDQYDYDPFTGDYDPFGDQFRAQFKKRR